ncbi:MAG: protein translocase subunit SecF [Acidimicrobiales bacterium]
MSFLGALYANQTNIDFRRLWRYSTIVSGTLVVLTVILLLLRGLNLSIDFEGGGVWTVPVPDGVTVADGREAAGLAEARVQLVADPDGGNFIRVQAGTDAIDSSQQVVEGLAQLGGVSTDEVSVSTVGPTWGSQITAKAVRALVLFFVVVAFYLAWRLEWRMAVGALISVVHDLAITAGVYALFGFEVSPATVIALLTILGYSLYDTVVVYDKVLENQGIMGPRVSPVDLVNRSMNQVLMRSLNTTLATILPVASMLIIGVVLLGGDTLWDFALALFIGLILGTYSSVFVAAPMLVWLKQRDPALAEAAAKEAAKGTRRSGARSGPANRATGGAAPASGPVEGAPADGPVEGEGTAEDDVDSDDRGGVAAGSGRNGAGSVLVETEFAPRPRKKKRR